MKTLLAAALCAASDQNTTKGFVYNSLYALATPTSESSSHLGGRQLTHHRHNHSRRVSCFFHRLRLLLMWESEWFYMRFGSVFYEGAATKASSREYVTKLVCIYFEPLWCEGVNALHPQMRFTLHVGSVNWNFWVNPLQVLEKTISEQ